MNRQILISDKVRLNLNSENCKGLYLDSVLFCGVNYYTSALEKNNINTLIKEYVKLEYNYDIYNNINNLTPTKEDIEYAFKNILCYIDKYKIDLSLLSMNNIDELINILFYKVLMKEIEFTYNFNNICDAQSKINVSKSRYSSEKCCIDLITLEMKNSFFKSDREYRIIKQMIRVLYYINTLKGTNGVLENTLCNLFEYYKFIDGKKSINLYSNMGMIQKYKTGYSFVNVLNNLCYKDSCYLKHGSKTFKLELNASKKLRTIFIKQ